MASSSRSTYSFLVGFTGQRACDRRLRLLMDNNYIERKHVLYGVPSIYRLTGEGKKLIHVSKKPSRLKVEQIIHDIYVLDTAIYFIKKYGVKLEDIQTEKQLHELDGFGSRKHRPDFCFVHNKKASSLEVELTLKAKDRFEKNIVDNFTNYDYQIWVVENSKVKIRKILEDNSIAYPLSILSLEEVVNYVKSI